MQNIVIKKVPKEKIRNKGIGDYLKTKKGLEIRVANLGDHNSEIGVAVHELVESALVSKRGIKFSDINEFDKKNQNKKQEPGSIKGSPYKKSHVFANKIEALVLKELDKTSKT